MNQRAKSARASSAARMRSTPTAGRVYTVTKIVTWQSHFLYLHFHFSTEYLWKFHNISWKEQFYFLVVHSMLFNFLVKHSLQGPIESAIEGHIESYSEETHVIWGDETHIWRPWGDPCHLSETESPWVKISCYHRSQAKNKILIEITAVLVPKLIEFTIQVLWINWTYSSMHCNADPDIFSIRCTRKHRGTRPNLWFHPLWL